MNVILRGDGEPVSLLVDQIGGVLEVSQVPFEQPPSTVDERVRDLLLGAYTLPDRLLLALNARRVLDVSTYGASATVSPATPRPDPDPPAPRLASLLPKELPVHALVVDDSRAMRSILARLMTGLGFEVSQAGDGAEALAVLDSGIRPDVCLVDWNMPVMDGLTFIKTVRAGATTCATSRS